jgi:N-acetylglucosamine-6-phosphate deacetylase
VQIVWRAAAGRVALVTDAIAAAGVGDGRYRLGGVDVEVRNGVARGDDGMLGGSTVTMLESVRNLHALGVPLVDAVAAATAVPARAARRDLGVLTVGGPADVVVLDDNLGLRTVIVGGTQRIAA